MEMSLAINQSLKRFLFVCFFLNFALGSVVDAQQLPSIRRRVSTCHEFRRALQSNWVRYIDVIDDFDCDASTWNGTVVIQRDIAVEGIKRKGKVPQINWGTTSENIIAGADTDVLFRDLIFLQNDMGIGSIDILFFKANENSTAKFEFVVVGVVSCPFKLNVTSLEHLTRPSDYPGKQTGRQINENTIEASDIVLHWSGRNAVWHLYQVIFTCNILANNPSLLNYYELTVMSGRVFNSRRSRRREGESQDTAKLVVYILLSVIVAMVFSLIVWFLVSWTQRRRLPWRLELEVDNCKHYDEDEEENDTYGLVQAAHNKNSPTPENWDILDSEVNLGEPLGHGEFGRVYRGLWQGTTVAVKVIRHNERCLQTNIGGPLEAFFARHISHPNVVQTYQISSKTITSAGSPAQYFTSPTKKGRAIGDGRSGSGSSDLFGSFDAADDGHLRDANFETWLILEYCDKGSLEDVVASGIFRRAKRPSKLRMSFVIKTAVEIASAMNYLHSVRIIHGDLKMGNVLLKGDNSNGRGFICKVGDFGLSRFLAEDSHIETFTCGTVTHMPPELLGGGLLTSAADVYSFGILLWELLSGKKAFQGKNQGEIVLAVVNNGTRPAFPSNVPKDIRELIESCWRQEYIKRPIFPDIIDELCVMLQRYEKEEGLEESMTLHASEKQTARSSFFNPLEDSRHHGQHADRECGRQRNIRYVPKKVSSAKLHQTYTVSIQQPVGFLDSNRSLHLSLDAQDTVDTEEAINSSLHSSRSADGVVPKKSPLQTPHPSPMALSQTSPK